MSKIYLFVFAVSFLIFPGLSITVSGQQSNTGKESNPELQAYEKQAQQLVEFIESTFNTLGDPGVTIREKDIIINDSYLKLFRDEKVQIEDDLDEYRLVVTNKNVQAYLKDITFFFKQVTFDFTIEEISQEITETGQVFFKVSLQRNLTGTTIGDSLVNNVRMRYIEINLDQDKKDLKIASIYTTKLSEQGDMANWWYQLPYPWKAYFSKPII
jgi:hypothetical protein